MPQKKLVREVGSADFTEGGNSSVDLPRSHYYRAIDVVVDYTITVNTAPTSPTFGRERNIVDSLNVQADGNKNLKQYTFLSSWFSTEYEEGTEPTWEKYDSSSAGTYSGTVATRIYFAVPDGNGGSDFGTAVPAFTLSDFTLNIGWGITSDVDTGDITIDSATAHILTHEQKRSSVAKPQSKQEQKVVESRMVYKERQVNKTVDKDGDNPVSLPLGNAYYGIQVFDADGSKTPQSGITDVEVLENNVDTHIDSSYSAIRAKDKTQYGLENVPARVGRIDFGRRGDFDQVIPTQGLDAFDAVFTASGPASGEQARLVLKEIVES